MKMENLTITNIIYIIAFLIVNFGALIGIYIKMKTDIAQIKTEMRFHKETYIEIKTELNRIYDKIDQINQREHKARE